VTVPACLRLADEVFPRVRGLAARQLVAHGWSQQRAGQAVGLSQAMVSRHLAAPAPDDAVAQRLAEDLVETILAGESAAPVHGPSAWCATLTIGQERAGGDDALRDLRAAENHLRQANPVRLMPQVGLNLARALPGASSAEDVLAFPGRLVEAGGRILSPAPPAFGGSGHLARVLLALRAGAGRAEALALANVRGGAEPLDAAKRLGWRIVPIRRGPRGDGDADGPVVQAASSAAARGAEALHDPGAVGLEPCLYVLGADASDAALRILRLHDALVT
jgi:XRE family transcriptional regulator, thiamine biosynthesis regulator